MKSNKQVFRSHAKQRSNTKGDVSLTFDKACLIPPHRAESQFDILVNGQNATVSALKVPAPSKIKLELPPNLGGRM